MDCDALERTALAAAALPLAGGCYAVTWRDAVDGTLHTAYTDTLAGVGAGYAVARGGRYVVIEWKWRRQRIAETTKERVK